MSPVDMLLADLAARDIRLFVRDGRLGFDAAPGALTEPLKAQIRTVRAELIERLSAARVLPLTNGQARMWFINRMNRHSGDYTEHLAYEFSGPLDVALLERALGMILARHGALRAQFRDGRNGPEMVVPPAISFALKVVQVTADTLDDQLAAAAHRPIDLATDPHAVFTLFAVDHERHILSVSAHHAAWDGWSNGVFAADLEAAWRAASAGQSGLPPLSRDLTDRRPMADPTPAIERRRMALAGYPTLLRLPTDHPRPKIFDLRGAAIQLRIGSDVAESVTAFARRAGATPTMVMLAAFGLWLTRTAGVPKLLIGVPTAGRRDAEEEAMIGYLSETTVVPIDAADATDFASLVDRVRQATLAALADADAPFDRLVEALIAERVPDATPLVQVLFSMQPAPVRAPSLGDVPGKVIAFHNEAARADLTLSLDPAVDGGWNGTLTYATALFERATVSGWADQFLSLLKDLPAVWNRPLTSDSVAADDFATPTERRLATLWGEFLRTPPNRRDDDFFMLGGHSLLLMRLVNRISEAGLGQIDLADAMAKPTIAGMAAHLDGTASAPTLDCHPAAPSQEGIWLERRDDPNTTHWLVPFAVDIKRHVDEATIAEALTALAARHAAIRSTLFERDGELIEAVTPPCPVTPIVHERP